MVIDIANVLLNLLELIKNFNEFKSPGLLTSNEKCFNTGLALL